MWMMFLSELGPLPVPSTQSSSVTIHSPRELVLTAQETEVLNQVSSQPTSIDEILRACKIESSRVLATLTILEMRRLIRRQPGNLYVRHD
jgi:DNA processing protein